MVHSFFFRSISPEKEIDCLFVGVTCMLLLPYFGVAYNVPNGGGKGLNFSAPLSEYTSTYSKKGNAKITLKVRNEEDNYLYNITIYPNGSSNIQVTPTNRQSISLAG